MTKQSKRDPVPALEWVAAALGLLVMVGLLFVLGREIANGGDDDLPVLSARVERISRTPTAYVVDIRVTNASAQTAAAVQVAAKLGEEESTATVDYVPGRSDARIGLLFQSDPRAGQLELRVVGYDLP